jgi:hypothetical protein
MDFGNSALVVGKFNFTVGNFTLAVSNFTPVATAECRARFETLVSAMRDLKKRYFLTPPLQDADYISLGLKLHDSIPTQSGAPTAQVTIETYLPMILLK